MEEFIREGFTRIERLGLHASRGEYDLITSDGYLILPTAWEATVKPGLRVKMYMRTPNRRRVVPGQHVLPEQKPSAKISRRSTHNAASSRGLRQGK
jgi:hypothetical protein